MDQDELQEAIRLVELAAKRIKLAKSRLVQVQDIRELAGHEKITLMAEAGFATRNGKNLLKSADKLTNALLQQTIEEENPA